MLTASAPWAGGRVSIVGAATSMVAVRETRRRCVDVAVAAAASRGPATSRSGRHGRSVVQNRLDRVESTITVILTGSTMVAFRASPEECLSGAVHIASVISFRTPGYRGLVAVAPVVPRWMSTVVERGAANIVGAWFRA